jgi:hypothetical protein
MPGGGSNRAEACSLAHRVGACLPLAQRSRKPNAKAIWICNREITQTIIPIRDRNDDRRTDFIRQPPIVVDVWNHHPQVRHRKRRPLARAKARAASPLQRHVRRLSVIGSETQTHPPRPIACKVSQRQPCPYLGGGAAGRSELNMSTAASHRPSLCLCRIVTNLPESLTGPGAPGGTIVMV